MCRGIERRRIFWEDSGRDDFLKRLEAILIEPPNPYRADPEAWQTARPRLRQKPLYHWAIRSLGMTAVAISKLLGNSQSAATRAAYRGEAITTVYNLTLVEGHNA